MVNYPFNIMNQELPSYSPNCIKIFYMSGGAY